MGWTRYLTIALFIFSSISAASALQCSDRYLEEFSSQGGKDAWLKNMRGVQNQAKQALRTGVWSDGKKLSNERLRQIRDAVQEMEEDIAEGSACSLPGQSASTPSQKVGNQSGSAASNCPSEYSWPFSAGCGSKLRVLPNGHLLYNGCPEAGDSWKDEGPIGASNDRRGLGWPGLDEFYECHLAARKGSSVTASAGAASAQAGPNVGNASEVIGQRSNRKNAFNPTSPHGDSARNQSGSSDGECKNGDPSCAIRGCNRSGGKAITYRNTAGCGVVSCRFADTKYDWSSVYNNIPGSGCVGSTK